MLLKELKNVTKEQKRGFLGMLLGTLGATLVRNMLTGLASKQVIRVSDRVIRS